MAKKLTSEEIRKQTFTTTRLREGFTIEEVESFLNDVERTVRSHEKEIADLRTLKGDDSSGGDTAELTNRIADLEEKNQELEGFKQWVEESTSSMGGSLKALTQQDSSKQLAEYKKRILELEEQLEESGESKRERDSRTATRIINLAQENADKLVSEAEEEAAMITKQATDHASAEITRLEEQKAELLQANHYLQGLEKENRERLKMFYTHSLQEIEESRSVVEPVGETPPPAPPVASSPAETSSPESHPVEVVSEPNGDGADNGAEEAEAADTEQPEELVEDISINDWVPPKRESSRKKAPSNSPPVQQFPSFFEAQKESNGDIEDKD